MNAKEMLFKELDKMKSGQVFKTADLVSHLNAKVRHNHFHDTYLRYIREWRALNTDVVCISKKESTYKKVS